VALLKLRRRRQAIAGAILFSFVLAAGDPITAGSGPHVISVADAAPVEADQVKAAFLFNFAKFVTWPKEAVEDRTIAICVFDDEVFETTLEQVIGGRSVGDRAVVVDRRASADEARGCDIVFIPASERARSEAIIDRLAERPILTVGDTEGFAARGGIVNFRVEENRVRFEVNPDAAKRAGLELSSQLLKLAILVRE
jgi:hypothetical protein